ncbi:hypothetical protein IT396_02570 [Candidatus Nomurabacteria bacterium]|nr:hypothetical protein [Candidatus Nomurabacteria bacterium]
MGYILLILALLFNALANIALKLGAAQFAALRETGIMRAVFENPYLLGGVALFACNVVLYALALSRIPLSVGYPIMVAGGIVIVTLASVLYMRETIGISHFLGLGFLLIGIVLISYK